MTDTTDLVDRYIAIWNETDAGRRRALIDRTWAEAATYVDPMMRGDGRAAIDAMIAAVQERFPGHRFRRTSDIDAHNGRVRFRWELGPEDGPVLVYEFAAGINGAELPHARKLDAEQALDVAAQVISALRSGERQRIPHGDLKPANFVFAEHPEGRPFTLVLDWNESGGPAPKRTRRPGFGSRLINMVIERQLNGQVQQSFGPEGLEAKLTVPLTHERWPGGARTAAQVDLP